MFCHKCGNQIADTAAFCPKCGVKLTANDTAQQTAAPTSAGQLQPQVNNPQPDIAQKKKSRKLPIIVGAIAIALAFVVILIAANFDDLQERGEQARKDEEYIASQQQSSDINLSETYMNETEGFSFKYPRAWVVVNADEIKNYYTEAESENIVVFLANETKDAPELNSYIEVLKFPSSQKDIDHLWISDEEFKATFADDVSITKTSIIQLDKVPARMIAFATTEDIIYRSYFYGVDSNLYRVNFIRKGKVSANDERFFDAVIDSFTVTAANTSSGEISSGSDVFADVLNGYIGHINDGTYKNGKYVFYDIDGNGIDELLVCYEDMMDEYTNIYTYVDGTTYKIGEFWSRNRLLLDEDGNFYIMNSNNAANTTLELARISSKGTDLVTTEAWEMNGYIFTHTSQNGDDVISEREYQIASNRFFNITTDFVDSLNWQPLSATVGNGTLDNSDSAGVTTNNISETTDQVLFCGIPVQDVIGMTANEVVAKFGEPEVYTEDGMDYGCDTPNRMQFGIMNENIVYGFSASPENFTFNGQNLNQNFDTMVTILGDTYIEQSGSAYDFEIAWYYEGCEISFRFPAYQNQAEDDRVIDVSVYPVG